MPEDTMRLVACLAMGLMLILANAAQTGGQAPSDQGYRVNRSADFYPYTGEPCKSGYQLGSGNCRKTNGSIVAVPREECLAQAGTSITQKDPILADRQPPLHSSERNFS
jgi:hypothetical protein